MNATRDDNNRVLLGMSGGVDSAVSALLLLQAGYEVIGCTCLFCGDDDSNVGAIDSARSVCEQLGIEHVVHDVRDAFTEKIIVPFCENYASGSTPSPCVMCNEKMKLPSLISAADEHDCHWVATGHYARVGAATIDGHEELVIAKHANPKKDQSYMLARLAQDILSRLVLPLSEVTDKDEVRSIATGAKLSCAHKNDSQDICFAPDGHKKLMADMGYDMGLAGDIVNSDGDVLGRHDGLASYTIGQRRGIGISNPAYPLYVIGKDAENNTLVVGSHEELSTRSFTMNGVIYQKESALTSENLTCQTRYHMEPVACSIAFLDNNAMLLMTAESIVCPAPGQYCVIYDGDDVVACGVIN